MIRQCVFVLTTCLLAISQNSVAADPFVEQNGRLLIEVESGAAEGSWSTDNEIHGYTGTAYLVWNGENNYAKPQAVRGNPIEYRFIVTTPGNYELRWRSRNTKGLDATEHNDSWVQFPTGSNIDNEHFLDGWTKAYMGQVAQWTWDVYTVDSNNKPIRQFFDAGEHVIQIAGRSNGHALDRFALFRYELENFNVNEFDALAQSPRTTQLQQPSHPYAGNSCVGESLTLTPASVLSNTTDNATTQSDQEIVLSRVPDYAYLKFDLPQDTNPTGASLKLASNGAQSLQLSAYLGSHSNWNTASGRDSLPNPTALLNTINDTAAHTTFSSINISPAMLADSAITILLNTEPGQTQTLYGLHNPSEPRLELQVDADFCETYNLRRTGTDNSVASQLNVGTGAVDQDSAEGSNMDETTDNEVGQSEVETTVSHNNSQPDVNALPDNSTQQGTDSSDNNEMPASVEQLPNTDNVDELTNEPASTKRRGGSVSLWMLLLLVAFTSVIRSRYTAQTC